jgi:hypothetical protein
MEAMNQQPLPEKSTEETPDSGTKRVNVIFSTEQYQTLQDLANKQDISLSDALRQAINVSKLVVDANEDKDTRVLIDKAGKIQELKIVR